MGADPSPGSLTTWQELQKIVPAGPLLRTAAEAWMAAAGTGFLASRLEPLPDGSWRFAVNFPAMLGIAAQTSVRDLWDEVARIQRPTLVARGTRSPYVTEANAARLRAMAHVRLADVDAGHALHMEAPGLLSRWHCPS